MRNGAERMRITDRLRGTVHAEICSAYPEAVINACAKSGIVLHHVERMDACTLRVIVFEKEWTHIQRMLPFLQAEASVLEMKGGSRQRAWIIRRAVLLFSLLCVGAMLVWSGLRIWEIEVRGCEKLTRGQVLRALEESGVTVGSFWPSLSPDAVRARMLLRIPELAWMTVNVSGSRAVVHVVERIEKPEIYTESAAADILASRSGILRKLTVLNGRPLVSEGNAVVKGDFLITGSMDSLSHPVRCVRSEACVMADTWYEWTAVEPEGAIKKGREKNVLGCLALRFGKKRVNLFVRSRKELDGYDKIVHEYIMGVKGLFSFPVALIREEYRCGERTEKQALSAGNRLRLLLSEQIEGEILQARFSTVCRDDCRYTTLRAHCLENIAQTAERDPP